MNLLTPRHKWILKNCQGKIILDVGFAGSGSEQEPLFKNLQRIFPQAFLIGLDFDGKKVSLMGEKNSLVGNGKQLPIRSETIDTMILGEILEHQIEHLDFLTESYRVLKKDGVLLVTTPNPYGLFRWLKNFLFVSDITIKSNVKDFLGYHDHKMFFEPVSLVNVLSEVGFRNVEYTSTNPSYPYLPEVIKEFQFSCWPWTRLGTTSCFKAIK